MSIAIPLTSPLVRPLTRAITEAGVAAIPSAFSAAKAAIVADAGDVNILVLGDSTSDTTAEWPYLFGQWLATQYPAFSVGHRLWNDGTNVYGAASVISTGSGANTITIWNASVGGTNPVSMMLPTKYPTAVEALSPDVVIWNYGHNLYTADAAQMLVVDNAYSPWVERVQFTHPDAAVALFTQNPRRDDNNYAAIYSMICEHAADKPRVALIDSYALFMAAGKAAALYADNVHPSAAGQQLYLSAIVGAWGRTSLTTQLPADPWLSVEQSNLLLNGDFAAWPGATPTSWTLGASATASKELVIVDGADPYSLKIEQTGGGQANVSQLLDAAGLAAVKAAGRMSYAVRRNAPTSADTFTGYIQVLAIAPTSGNVSRTSFVQNARLENEFYWTFLRDIPIPSDTTSVRCYLYASGAVRANAIAYFSRAIAVAGDLPRDMP